MTPFRNEKNSNWEGAYVYRHSAWPGKIKAGSVSNEIVSHMDWLPTLLAMAGEPDIKKSSRKDIAPAIRLSRFIWTATTCCLI